MRNKLSFLILILIFFNFSRIQTFSTEDYKFSDLSNIKKLKLNA